MKTEKQKEILLVAKRLIVDKGFMETSIRDIALEMKTTPSSLYNHFQSKDQILELICTDVRERFHSIRLDISSSNQDPKIKFYQFIRRYILEILHDEEAFYIYAKYFNYSEKYRNQYQEGQMIFIDFLQNLMNEVRPQEDPKTLVKNAPVIMMIYALNSVPKLIKNRENFNIDDVVMDIYSYYAYGIVDRP